MKKTRAGLPFHSRNARAKAILSVSLASGKTPFQSRTNGTCTFNNRERTRLCLADGHNNYYALSRTLVARKLYYVHIRRFVKKRGVRTRIRITGSVAGVGFTFSKSLLEKAHLYQKLPSFNYVSH